MSGHKVERIDRHTEGDGLILRTVRAQSAGPATTSYAAAVKLHTQWVCVRTGGCCSEWMADGETHRGRSEGT